MRRKIIALLVSGLVFTGCYYDNEDQLYNCTTNAAGTKYSSTVTSILDSYGCKGCHVGSVPSGGINLETYAGVKSVVSNGKFYGAISHSPGFSPMPQGG